MVALQRCPFGSGAMHASLSISLLFPLNLLLLPTINADSQPPSSGGGGGGSKMFDPPTGILIVGMISAFFILGFLSVFVRLCICHIDDYEEAVPSAAVRRAQTKGLDTAVLGTFPVMLYSEALALHAGEGALECAVCLSEFDDDDKLRLLPRCSHVFHPDCIDAWLSAHVTCPLCRRRLDVQESGVAASAPGAAEAENQPTSQPRPATPTERHVIDVSAVEESRIHEEMLELRRIGNEQRATRPRKLRRSHSTGHSLALSLEEGMERFTLQLAENVRREIIAAGEESLRRCRQRGADEGSGRDGRSFRVGRRDRWPALLSSVRRGRGGVADEGSSRGRRTASGSVKGGSRGGGQDGDMQV